jgi:hypothetical protein
MIEIIYWVLSVLVTFPLTHVFLKKGMVLDHNISDETYLDLNKFFYIPYLNVIVSFFYLIWVVVKFKRPE